MGSFIGSQKIAAKRLGISFEQYIEHLSKGLKSCTKCKTWKPQKDFAKDITRGDGLKSACRYCDYPVKRTTPRIFERREKLAEGFRWCKCCNQWLCKTKVNNVCCKSCVNKQRNTRYAADETYRNKVKERTHSRKRKLDPMPTQAKELRLFAFEGKCAYCSIAKAVAFDHIVPVRKGGKTTPDNMLPVCTSCNSSKHTKDVYKWFEDKGIIPPVKTIEWLAFMGHFPE